MPYIILLITIESTSSRSPIPEALTLIFWLNKDLIHDGNILNNKIAIIESFLFIQVNANVWALLSRDDRSKLLFPVVKVAKTPEETLPTKLPIEYN